MRIEKTTAFVGDSALFAAFPIRKPNPQSTIRNPKSKMSTDPRPADPKNPTEGQPPRAPGTNPEATRAEAVEELVAYLDGELDPKAARAVETKLTLDPAARAEADSLKRTWELLDFLPRPEAPADFTQKTVERLEPLKQQGSGSRPSQPVNATVPEGQRAAPSTAQSPVVAGSRRGKRLRGGLAWAAALLLAGFGGYIGRGWVVSARQAPPDKGPEALQLSDLRVLENVRLYRNIDNLEYLKALDHPELFGDDGGAGQ